MKRRSFIKKTSATGLALTVIPSITLAQSQETTYSLAELMGKATIELYGKDIKKRSARCFYRNEKSRLYRRCRFKNSFELP